MTPHASSSRSGLRFPIVAVVALSLGAASGLAQPAPARAPTPVAQQQEEIVKLSPFVVDSSKDEGYRAQNTLAGSRMRMNLADLPSSVSVVTSAQMQDTASVDINDVFRYEVNTEGSLRYTPGTPTFRNDGVLDVNAGGTQGNAIASFTNATANRVRGLGVPSMAINYFPSISQIPMDNYNVQSLEISRGPNSLLFGLGSPAGIVNQSTARAALGRNSYTVTARTDSNGSARGTVAFNRTLLRDRLAIYGAIVYDDRKFERKPSYDLTKRQYGALTYKPFAKTTIWADVENYVNDNRRPNTLTPRDFVTQWNLAGRPAWDPLTRQVTLGDGTVKSINVVNTASPYLNDVRNFIMAQPGYSASRWNAARTTYNGVSIAGDAALTNAAGFNPATGVASNNILFVPGITWVNNRTVQQIGGGQLFSWFQPLYANRPRAGWGTATNPAGTADFAPTEAAIWANRTWADFYNRGWTASTGWTALNNGIIGYKYPGVTDKSVYDWSKININQMNWGRDINQNFHVEFEQEILDNLYLNAGWFRQDFSSRTNYTVSQLNITTLFVDTNKYLPNGTANIFFGKPYVEDVDPDRYINKSLDDHYRAMVAWTPDFTRWRGIWKWLGHHQILGMASRDTSMQTSIRRRFAFMDSATFDGKVRYLPNENNNADGTPTGWNLQSSYRRQFYLAGQGDPVGVVTRSSGQWDYTTYRGDISIYNYPASALQTVNVTTQFNTFDGSGRSQRVVNSLSGGINSYLWNDRLIATFGVRQDKYKGRVTNSGLPAVLDWDNSVLFPAITNAQKWVNGAYQTDLLYNRWNKWLRIDGTTRTYGGVLRPFQRWNSIDSRAARGSVFWEFVRDFGISYNESSNFNPPADAQGDSFGNPLPKPTGKGRDYGVQFSLLNNKLFARVTWFKADNQFERVSATSTIGRLEGNIDTTLFRNWARTIAMINMGMDPTAAGFGQNLSQTVENQVQAAAEVIWQQPYNYYQSRSFGVGATRSASAKGYEVEVSYNPQPNWTMRLTFAKQDTKYNNVLNEFTAWFNHRNPVWQAARAADFLSPQYLNLATYTTSGGRAVDLTNFWTSYGYTPEVRLDEPNGNYNVEDYYNINVTPQVTLARDLEGQSAPDQRKYHGSFLTDYRFTAGRLKGFAIGGAESWESKAVIGYYGRASGANGTSLDVSDISRPIYDSDNTYTDLWISYSRPVFNGKVRWKIQLNINNVFENGHLQKVAVNYDGSPYSFRIVDPRQFILTNTFDF